MIEERGRFGSFVFALLRIGVGLMRIYSLS
jgi:hypothetical protein